MLIESQIRYSVRDLAPEHLDEAIAGARQAMSLTRDEFNEHVALQDVVLVNGHKVRYCVRGLITHSEKEYIFNLATGELFAFQATYSHIDLDTIRFLRGKECIGFNPGF